MPASTASHESGDDRSEDELHALTELGDSIDIVTFEQILEMDDDTEEREFSRSIVVGFFDQAESTFENLENALKEKDLATLSSLGHFLKGSSATLGLTKVRDSCEKIQHYGSHLDDTGAHEVKDDQKCLDNIKATLAQLRDEYDEVEAALKKFYKHEEGKDGASVKDEEEK